MKRVLAIVFLLVIVFGAWWLFFKTDKQTTAIDSEEEYAAIAVNKHSAEFNAGVSKALSAYFDMKDAFVNADTSAAKNAALQFVKFVDEIPVSELENDDPKIRAAADQQISDLKANAEPISAETDITSMRQDFRMVSENLYPFLKTIGYEGEKLYWQNCPMAFGENEANWLSNTRQIINPYLGKNHPEFKSSMLNCGEVKDSIYNK